MKKIIMLAVLLAITVTTALSQQNESKFTSTEKKIPVSAFNQLIIDGDFKLTLVESDVPYIYIKGSPAFTRAFTVHQIDNSLLVNSLSTRNSYNNQVIIPVKNLKKLVVRQNASIDAVRMIMPDDLKVLLEAECVIWVNKSDLHKIEVNDNLTLEVLKKVR